MLEAGKNRIGCVIMASGMSVRFGSNKLLAEFRGQTLLERTLALTAGLFDRRVVVTRTHEVGEICREMGVEVIRHQFPGRNDAVRLGVEALRNMDALVFCPCDQPLLRRESLHRMISAADVAEETILRLAWGERAGAPVLFGKGYFEQLCRLPERSGGGHVIRQYPDRVRLIPVDDEGELMDVDTPEDLIKLNR